MEEVGNAKIKVLMWLLSEADSQNQILATYKKLRKVQAWALPPSRA